METGTSADLGLNFDRAGIEGIYKSPFIDGNRVELLSEGRKAFMRIFDAVWRAEEIVCLQFYIFRNDETGTALANILKAKSAQGVKVFLLYDFHGSLGTPRAFWRGLKKAGVQVRASHPFNWSSPRRYVHRDHRKVLIVDGKEAFTGGFNIGNEYHGRLLRIKKRLVKAGKPWRDTGIMIEGPAASALLKTFKKAWVSAGGGRIDFEPPQAEDAGGLPVIPIFAHSSRGRRRMRRLLYYSINHARSRILLTTAYFIPSRRMLETLEGAVRRGVSVKLLVPGQSDVPPAHHAGRAFFSRLLKAGVEIFTYSGPMLHAKTYIFDRSWCIVGSANLDFLSMRWNDEGNVGILDVGFAARMAAQFEKDLEKSVKIELDGWKNRPLGQKIKEWFFALFRRRM